MQNADGRGALVTGHAELAGDGFGVEFVVKLADARQRQVGEGVSVNAEHQPLLVHQRKVRVENGGITWLRGEIVFLLMLLLLRQLLLNLLLMRLLLNVVVVKRCCCC